MNNRPALIFSLPFIAGILVGWHWGFPLWYVLGTALLFLLAGVIALTNWESTKHSISLFFLPLIFLGGIFKITLDKNPPEKSELAQFLDFHHPVLVKGILTDPLRRQGSRFQFVVDGETITVEGKKNTVGGSLLVSLNGDSIPPGFVDSLEYGDVVEIAGVLRHPRTARNPGEFDFRNYLHLRGIYARCFVENVSDISIVGKRGNWFLSEIIYPLRRSISRRLDSMIGGEEAHFLRGLIIGERSEITQEVKDSFINSGVMHILAVSGLHVGLIVFILTGMLTVLRISEKLKIIVICLLLIGYIFLTGSSPPVVRAVIMAIVVIGAKLFERKGDIVNSLAFAAILILLVDAQQLFMPGFQLSFVAVLAIVLLYPVFYSFAKNLPEEFTKDRFANSIVQLVCMSLAAGLGTLPFTSLYFGKIPLIGLLANIVVVPMSGIVLAAGMTAVSFSFVSNILGSLYSEAARLSASILLESVKFFGGFSFSYFNSHFSLWNILVYYAALAIILNIDRFITMKRFVLSLLAILNIIVYVWVFGFFGSSSQLRVTFLDVGQGDAVFVEFPDGKNMLIDAGPLTRYTDAGARFVVPFLKTRGISHVDVLMVTHPHSDHAGGVLSLLREFSIAQVVDAGTPSQSLLFGEYIRLLDSLNLDRRSLTAGMQLEDFSHVRMYVLHPSASFAISDPSVPVNFNNRSIVVRCLYGETSALFVGDAEEEAEMQMLRVYGEFLRSDILKVGHHGSDVSSSVEFLDAVNPDWAVISVGRDNKFSLPSSNVLQRFVQRRVRTYRTDKDNAVVFVSDGHRWRKEEWR